MNGIDLYAELDAALNAADECIRDMPALRRDMAQAEKDYRVAKRARILFERDHNKTPVSLIGDIVKGYEDIAQLAFERDCRETEYQANYEAILFHKKRADAIREQLQREWSQAGRGL